MNINAKTPLSFRALNVYISSSRKAITNPENAFPDGPKTLEEKVAKSILDNNKDNPVIEELEKDGFDIAARIQTYKKPDGESCVLRSVNLVDKETKIEIPNTDNGLPQEDSAESQDYLIKLVNEKIISDINLFRIITTRIHNVFKKNNN